MVLSSPPFFPSLSLILTSLFFFPLRTNLPGMESTVFGPLLFFRLVHS